MNSHRHQRQIVMPTESHPVILYAPDGSVTRTRSLQNVAVFPGSFNPLHAGHCQLADVAAKRLKLPVVFEISVSNVDKNSLNQSQLIDRIQQFASHTVAVTNASRFLQKSDLFAGCPFVVGFDTAARILHPRFYGHNPQQLQNALNHFQHHKHRFVVGGRLTDSNGQTRFHSGDELPIPADFVELFDLVPEAEFRADVSSTNIRRDRGSEG